MEQPAAVPTPDAKAEVAGIPAPPLASPPRRAPRRGALGTFRRSLVWYAFVGPAFLLLLLFVGYPTFQTFKQSFFEQAGTHQRFAGLNQYSQLVHQGDLTHALWNTALLGCAYLVIVIPLAVVLASLLNKVRRGATPLKVIY